MSKLGERLKRAREEKGISRKKLAQELHIDPKNIYEWEKGKVLPSSKYLAKLSKILNISLDWLLTGEGEMNKSPMVIKETAKIQTEEYYPFHIYIKEQIEKKKINSKELIEVANHHIRKYSFVDEINEKTIHDLFAGKILTPAQYEAIRDALHFPTWKDFLYATKFKYSLPEKYIPVVAKVTASFPYPWTKDPVEDHIPVFINSPAVAGLIVEGDSMLPEIKPGDVVLVAGKEIESRTGGFVVAKIKKDNHYEGTVKKLTRKQNQIILSPLNPAYDPLIFPSNDHKARKLERFKVIAVHRNYLTA